MAHWLTVCIGPMQELLSHTLVHVVKPGVKLCCLLKDSWVASLRIFTLKSVFKKYLVHFHRVNKRYSLFRKLLTIFSLYIRYGLTFTLTCLYNGILKLKKDIGSIYWRIRTDFLSKHSEPISYPMQCQREWMILFPNTGQYSGTNEPERMCTDGRTV